MTPKGRAKFRIALWVGRKDTGLAGDTESAAEHGDAFRDGGVGIFFPFHFEGDVTGIVSPCQNIRDAAVIKIEGIPLAASVVGFGLHKDRAWGDLFEFIVGILQEIPSIHQDAEPGRTDGVRDGEQSLRGASQAPMILKSEHDAAFGGLVDAFPDGIDAPIQAVFLGVSREHRFFAAGGHEIVEGGDGIPTPGIEADAGDTEFVSDLDAFVGVIDLLGAVFGFGIDEVLMN